MSVKDTVLDKTQSIQEYISIQAPKDELLRECLRQKQTWEEGQAKEMSWQDKTLRRMYHQWHVFMHSEMEQQPYLYWIPIWILTLTPKYLMDDRNFKKMFLPNYSGVSRTKGFLSSLIYLSLPLNFSQNNLCVRTKFCQILLSSVEVWCSIVPANKMFA